MHPTPLTPQRRGRRRYTLAAVFLALAVCAALLLAGAATRSGAAPATRVHAAAPHIAVRLGPTPPSQPLTLTIVLRGQSPAALNAVLAAIGDPSSPEYRHYLTPDEYTRRFGPTTQEQARVAAALRALGFTVPPALAAGSGLLTASGTARLVESVFGVPLDDYRAPDGRRYYAAASAPRLPASLAPDVTGVLGLSNRDVVTPSPVLVSSTSAQISGVAGMTPADLDTAYNLGPLRGAGLDGSNQTIALAEIDTFRQSDITAYDSTYHLNAPRVQVVRVAGGASGNSPEPVLDIEVIHAIAPHAAIIAYEAPSDLGSLIQMFSQIVHENRAHILSISLGTCELGLDQASAQSALSALDSTFSQADAEGMSVLVASGDSGAYGCQNDQLSVELPASSPYVTAVGGTALFVTSSGGYEREAGWEGPLEGAGGGGGLSVYYSRPSWQGGPGVSNSYSNGMREVPDVSADADPLTGYRIYFSGGNIACGGRCWTVVGGTSAAAPLWAGLVALANQSGAASGKRLGFLNPALYRLGASGTAGSDFHDVTLGGNLYYPATPTWDFSTGWGSPDGANLVHDLLALS